MFERIRSYVKSKNLDRWLVPHVKQQLREVTRPASRGTTHLLVAVCDHYEPLWAPDDNWQAVSYETGLARVHAWENQYPKLANQYVDADGYHPRHSFFFPGEQYHESYLAPLTDLVAQGLGEVELHLHHNNDTADNLRATILRYLDLFAEHGHLSRDSGGRLRYAFIHGDWALCNARADGSDCGVDQELPILFETGCYADFTFPAAPDPCQPSICNQIYWPVGDLSRRRAHENGEHARVGRIYSDRVLLIQGPLTLGLRPRTVPIQIENSDLTAVFPPTPQRVRSWISQRIHIQGRPEWVFIKLHTHGAPESTAQSLFGSGGHALHTTLTEHYNDGDRWQLHYVTAREMYNIAIAAMSGCTGNPGKYRDYMLPRPPAAGHYARITRHDVTAD